MLNSNPVAFIFAHPDDESFLSAAFIIKLAREGNRPVLLLATKGDKGNKNGPYPHLTSEELAFIREKEMDRAAKLLGLDSVTYLNYPDSKLDSIDKSEFVEHVTAFLNKHQSSVVVTFPEDGGNGHADHIAISHVVTKAVTSGKCPFVHRLYYVLSGPGANRGDKMGLKIDTERFWEIKAAALRAHESQILAVIRYFGDLDQFPEMRRYEAMKLAWERRIDGWEQAED